MGKMNVIFVLYDISFLVDLVYLIKLLVLLVVFFGLINYLIDLFFVCK